MKKTVSVVLVVVVLLSCMLLCSCNSEKYQCDMCKDWYEERELRGYLVSDVNVDVVLCPDCYEKQPMAEDVLY